RRADFDPAVPTHRLARAGSDRKGVKLAGGKRWLFVALVVIALLQLFTRWMNRYYLGVSIDVAINVILAVSLNLINGHTGQFSLGHAGFMAVGGFTSARLTLEFAQSVPPAGPPA